MICFECDVTSASCERKRIKLVFLVHYEVVYNVMNGLDRCFFDQRKFVFWLCLVLVNAELGGNS